MNNPQDATPVKPPIKRGIVIIKKGIQVKFIVLVMLSFFMATCLVLWDVYFLFGRDVLTNLMDPGLYELFAQARKVLVLKLGLYLIFVGVVTVFISHKVAGPLYRFEKSARAVAAGDLTHRVLLRKGDELTDLQGDFNKM